MSALPPAARAGLVAGLRDSVPMAVGSFPFGLAYGVGVAAAGLDPWVGASASWTVLAGAAQLSMLSLIEQHASWLVVVLAGLVVNARFALYSIALAPAFKDFPERWRFTLPYLMTDQAAALSLHYFSRHPNSEQRRWYYLGAALGVAVYWWGGTVFGVTLGNTVPASIDIAFTVPLVFVVLLVPSLVDRPSLVAAVVAAVGTVAATSLPSGLNAVAGAGLGVFAGGLAQRRAAR